MNEAAAKRSSTDADAVIYDAVIATPFARIGIRIHGERIVRIDYLAPQGDVVVAKNALAREACGQIRAYVRDPMHRFDLPCAPEGTDFQHRVWRAISRIPSGRTQAYGELATWIGSAPRPVGGACGSNPIPLIVPCHRVVAAGGQLGGFMHSRSALPLSIKRWLLRHEAA
jgi:methylated-DNA-[protein]-cysteine S-methyltransferase